MSFISIVKVKIDYNGKKYEARCRVEVEEDYKYGSDIDGNRGSYASWIRDIDIEEVYNLMDNILLEEIPDTLHDLICEKVEEMDLEPDE